MSFNRKKNKIDTSPISRNNYLKGKVNPNFVISTSPEKLRKWLINNVEFTTPLAYKEAFYAVINPTDNCSVGCAHCLYSSYKLGNPQIDKKTMDSFIRIANQAKIKMIVFSGGGEPMENLPQMLRAIKNIEPLRDVIIITSGHFAGTPKDTTEKLDKIFFAANKKRRKKGFSRVIITLRISRDNSQCKVIPLENISNILNYTIVKNAPQMFRILIRTLLDYGENQDLELASKLNFKLLPLKNKKKIYKKLSIIDGMPTRWLTKNNSDIEIPVIYKPIYLMGRATKKIPQSVYSLWKIVESEERSGTPFNLCLRGPKGEGHNYYETIFKGYEYWKRNIKKSVFNTPKSKRRKRLALYVPASGNILINNGAPDIAPHLNKLKNWQQFLKIVSKDPISRLIIKKGPFYIKNIAQEVEKELTNKIEKANFVFAISSLSLESPALRLYISLRILNSYFIDRKIIVNNPRLKKLLNKNKKFYMNIYQKQANHLKIEKAKKLVSDPITGDAQSLF